jgi:hypothetical protein
MELAPYVTVVAKADNAAYQAKEQSGVAKEKATSTLDATK